MLRKTVAFAVLVLLPGFGAASTYQCSVKQRGSKAEGPKELWSGTIALKARMDVKVLVIGKDGKAVSVNDIMKNAANDDAIRAAMEPYDGFLVIGLRVQERSLDLNLGHVEAGNKKDSAPMDVDAWSSAETKEIGVTDARKRLTALCRLE